MIEFDVDMSYLLECDELDKVILNDEGGEHEPMEFVPADATVGMGTCQNVSEYTNVFTCSECGYEYDFVTDPYNGPNYCPRCGRRIEES